jgi:hypothetical protein
VWTARPPAVVPFDCISRRGRLCSAASDALRALVPCVSCACVSRACRCLELCSPSVLSARAPRPAATRVSRARLTLAAVHVEQKEYSLPAKRLVFEDMASAGGESEKDNKIKALNEQVAELKKGMLTALADVENMRTRMKKTAEDDKKFAVRSFAKGMPNINASMSPLASCMRLCVCVRTHMCALCVNVPCMHAYMHTTCNITDMLPGSFCVLLCLIVYISAHAHTLTHTHACSQTRMHTHKRTHTRAHKHTITHHALYLCP